MEDLAQIRIGLPSRSHLWAFSRPFQPNLLDSTDRTETHSRMDGRSAVLTGHFDHHGHWPQLPPGPVGPSLLPQFPNPFKRPFAHYPQLGQLVHHVPNLRNAVVRLPRQYRSRGAVYPLPSLSRSSFQKCTNNVVIDGFTSVADRDPPCTCGRRLGFVAVDNELRPLSQAWGFPENSVDAHHQSHDKDEKVDGCTEPDDRRHRQLSGEERHDPRGGFRQDEGQ